MGIRHKRYINQRIGANYRVNRPRIYVGLLKITESAGIRPNPYKAKRWKKKYI